jgi:hypothetical protein
LALFWRISAPADRSGAPEPAAHPAGPRDAARWGNLPPGTAGLDRKRSFNRGVRGFIIDFFKKFLNFFFFPITLPLLLFIYLLSFGCEFFLFFFFFYFFFLTFFFFFFFFEIFEIVSNLSQIVSNLSQIASNCVFILVSNLCVNCAVIFCAYRDSPKGTLELPYTRILRIVLFVGQYAPVLAVYMADDIGCGSGTGTGTGSGSGNSTGSGSGSSTGSGSGSSTGTGSGIELPVGGLVPLTRIPDLADFSVDDMEIVVACLFFLNI